MIDFEKRIKPLILYIGFICATIMSIAYIVIVLVLIIGFKVEGLQNTIIYSVVNALVGFCIMQMLKIQGTSFAANNNKEIVERFAKRKVKERKYRSIKYYWTTSILKDIFSKCTSFIIINMGLIYIVIEGSKDYNLLLLAFVNLFMFIGFGLISLVKAYDFYNNEYVPYMLNELRKGEQKQ